MSISHRHTRVPPVPYAHHGSLVRSDTKRTQQLTLAPSCLQLPCTQRLAHTHTHVPLHALRAHGLFKSSPGSPGASSSQFLQVSQICLYPDQAYGHFDTWLPGHFFLLACPAWQQLAMAHWCQQPSLAGVVGTPGTWAFVTCDSNLVAGT